MASTKTLPSFSPTSNLRHATSGTWLIALGCGLGCGGDGGGTGTTDPTTSTDGSSTEPTTTSPTTTADTGTTTMDPPTTSTDPSTTGEDSSTGADTGSSESGTETSDFDCTMIPAAPFVPEAILEDVPFAASEDLGFDGQGHLAARGTGGAFLLVSPDGTYQEITTDDRATYGLRFLANGDIVAAAYNSGAILRVTPAGDVSSLATSIGGVNGLFPDSMGGVWYTDFGVVGYVTSDGNDVPVVNPASNANGIFFDEARQAIFFTNYGNGDLRRANLVDGVADDPVMIGSVNGNPDGITLDVCGNLYINDQGNSAMYRIMLDEAGDPLGEAEALIEGSFPTGVANAQFGTGDGWEAESLYAIGVGNTLYRIDVGVPGAPYVTVR